MNLNYEFKYEFMITLVLDAGRPNSYFLLLWGAERFPPVARRLCQLSREIPISFHRQQFQLYQIQMQILNEKFSHTIWTIPAKNEDNTLYNARKFNF